MSVYNEAGTRKRTLFQNNDEESVLMSRTTSEDSAASADSLDSDMRTVPCVVGTGNAGAMQLFSEVAGAVERVTGGLDASGRVTTREVHGLPVEAQLPMNLERPMQQQAVPANQGNTYPSFDALWSALPSFLKLSDEVAGGVLFVVPSAPLPSAPLPSAPPAKRNYNEPHIQAAPKQVNAGESSGLVAGNAAGWGWDAEPNNDAEEEECCFCRGVKYTCTVNGRSEVRDCGDWVVLGAWVVLGMFVVFVLAALITALSLQCCKRNCVVTHSQNSTHCHYSSNSSGGRNCNSGTHRRSYVHHINRAWDYSDTPSMYAVDDAVDVAACRTATFARNRAFIPRVGVQIPTLPRNAGFGVKVRLH